MGVELPSRVCFGVFELDLKAGEVRKGTRTILLQEQPFQILRMLVEHPGQVVTRDEDAAEGEEQLIYRVNVRSRRLERVASRKQLLRADVTG